MLYIIIQSLVQFNLLIILLLNRQQIQFFCREILNSDENRKMASRSRIIQRGLRDEVCGCPIDKKEIFAAKG